MDILLIVLLVILLLGTPYGYYRRADWGYAPGGLLTAVLVVVLVFLLLRGRL